MDDRIRVKVTGGPSLHSIRIIDQETGRLLPATDLQIRYNRTTHVAEVQVTLIVYELDLELDASLAKEIERAGSIVQQHICSTVGER